MKRFSDVRHKRNTALVMLLLWLFAVSSGIVNACVLEPHGTAATVGHAETLAGHNGTLDASMAPCLKVCNDSSQALIKLKVFFDLADRGSALTDSTLWAAAIQVVSARAIAKPVDPCGATSCSPRVLTELWTLHLHRDEVPKKFFNRFHKESLMNHFNQFQRLTGSEATL